MSRLVSLEEIQQREPARLDAIYKMTLNETIYVEADNSDPLCTSVMRVPGGWIYRSFDKGHGIMACTFVPFHNEYME